RWISDASCNIQFAVHFNVVQNQISFHDILELAHIAEPFIFDKCFHYDRRECVSRTGVSLAVLLKKVVCQHRNVCGTVPKCWNLEFNNVQSEVQIVSKLSCEDRMLLPIRCRQDSNVDFG